jgi:hypothetical protein
MKASEGTEVIFEERDRVDRGTLVYKNNVLAVKMSLRTKESENASVRVANRPLEIRTRG